jgi:hypothetical protein
MTVDGRKDTLAGYSRAQRAKYAEQHTSRKTA